jgi:hypothetical protein
MNSTLIVIVLIGALVVCAPVACTINRQNLLAQAAATGKDPIALRCAMDSGLDNSRTDPLCIARAMQPQQPASK